MRSKRDKMLSVRASTEEIERVKTLAADLMRNHPYLKEADVIRELIGLEDTGIITPTLRKRLRADYPIPSDARSLPTEPHKQYPTKPINGVKAKGGRT